MELLSFNEFINESVRLSLAKMYSHDWDKNRYRDLFLQYPHDKNAYRIFIDFKPIESKIKIPLNILDFFNKIGYDIKNYNSGLVINKKTNVVIKIGKLLRYREYVNDEESKNILNFYETDPSRHKDSEYLIVISRHPYDIAGMSTGRGWISCMELKDATGMSVDNKHIKRDIKYGTLIAYLIKKDDKNIENPTCRTLIKPYFSTEKPRKHILVPEKAIYGENIPGFFNSIKNWLKNVNNDTPPSVYKPNPRIYQDYGQGHKITTYSHVINPTLEELNHMSLISKIELAKNNQTTVEILEELSDESSSSVKKALASNPKTPEHILSKLSNDDNLDVLLSLCTNSSITAKIIKNLSKKELPESKLSLLARNKNNDDETAKIFMRSSSTNVRISLSTSNANFSDEIYLMMANDNNYNVRLNSMNDKASKKTLLKIAETLKDDNDDWVRKIARKNLEKQNTK